jgi:iron(III) transport system substrate-binding protein
MKKIAIAAAVAAASFGAAAQGQVNIICSVQADWCNLMATVYARTTGTKVNMTAKGSGEALAQLNAEKANPKTDIWFGGTGDPHLQAAEQGLTLEYKSEQIKDLHAWAQKQAADSRYRTVGVYLGPLGFGFNNELLAKKKVKAPCVVGRPAQARIQGRSADGQPGVQRHGLHHDCHAGATDGRGQGL